MVDRSLLRSARERALSLCAAALVHVVLALALPRARAPVSNGRWSALALIEIAPAPPPPPPPPESTVPVPSAPEPLRKPRARARAAPSSAAPAPAPTPERAPPAAALPLDLAPATPSDFAAAPAVSEPPPTDQPGRLPAYSLQSPSQSRSQAVSRALPAPAGFDRSRTLALSGGLDWRCAFPAEADDADVDRGTATLRIAADAHGRVREVAVLQDSGHGFGRAARNCAFSKTFVPARAAGGEAVAGELIVNVRFVR